MVNEWFIETGYPDRISVWAVLDMITCKRKGDSCDYCLYGHKTTTALNQWRKEVRRSPCMIARETFVFREGVPRREESLEEFLNKEMDAEFNSFWEGRR